MKKLSAIILSLILVFSCFAVPASAASGKGGVVGELATTLFEKLIGVEMEEDTPIGYGVIYEIDPLSGISVIYKPSPSISFKNPGTYTITSDTPLSVDYEFIRWEDSDGNPYYAGDKIYVDGTIYLTAVFVEKNDNDIRVARIIKTTIEAFKRLIGKFFGILDTFENFEPVYSTPGRYDLPLNKIYYEDENLSEIEGTERVLLYIDSYNFKDRLTRISDESKMNTAEITLFSGWNLETDEPINESKTSGLSYSFSDLNGPHGEDVLVIETGSIVYDYFAKHSDIKTAYMIVNVGTENMDETLYYSFTPDNGLDHNEFCTPISVAFTLTK